MENYGAVDEQQYWSGISDLDLPMTLGDINLPGLLDPPSPIACQDAKRQIFGSSGISAADCALAPDDPYTEVTEPPKKRRNQTAQTHNLTEKRRRDKINAKIKVLQELIPNADKLDRVSLLEKVISRIQTLQWQLQIYNGTRDTEATIIEIMQGMKSYPYFAPPLQQAGATRLSPFVPPIPPNMGFGTGPNAHMPTIQPQFAFGMYSLPFWHPIAANFGSMPPSLPPNPYLQPPGNSTFMQPAHAGNGNPFQFT